MATISFSEEIIVKDAKKVSEIMRELSKPCDGRIKAVHPPKLPHNAGAIWFKRSEK